VCHSIRNIIIFQREREREEIERGGAEEEGHPQRTETSYIIRPPLPRGRRTGLKHQERRPICKQQIAQQGVIDTPWEEADVMTDDIPPAVFVCVRVGRVGG